MKKFLKNRVLPFVCAFSILVSLCVIPASAEWDVDFDYPDMDSVAQIDACIIVPSNLEVVVERFGFSASTTAGEFVWNMIDRQVTGRDITGEVGLDVLHQLCNHYNFIFNRPLAETFPGQIVSGSQEVATDVLSLLFFGSVVSFEVREWGTSGYYRIYCPELDAYVVSSNGRYAYTPIPEADKAGGNQWLDFGPIKKMVDANSAKVNTSVSNLYWLQDKLTNAGFDCRVVAVSKKYLMVCSEDGEMVYCDRNGLPFVNPYDPDAWAALQERPAVDDPDDEVDDDFNTKFDIENGVINLPDGNLAFLNAVIYDESTKTYEIDASETYNTTNNYYFHYTFHINYTSITYIGTTEEYQKYEIAYELPDGRSSADLTKEDLEQLNLDVDVIPYVRSTDNTTVRSLYHFDGDTRDDSFWNYCTDFVWNDGASLTYMDVGVFEGALYLDENAHDFDFVLPSGMGSGDFTLQWRMYPSHTLAPQTDSYVQLGDVQAAFFDGAKLYNGKSVALDNYSTGIWNEFALIRNAGTIYYYINGLCVGSWSNTTAFDTIKFYFGDDQQTFKYFDELRVLNYALQDGGASYEPTAIPHGTNLALALPNEAVPVADEFYEFTHTDGYVNFLDFSTGFKPDALTYNVTNNGIGGASSSYPLWSYSKAESYMEYSDRFVTFSEGVLRTRIGSSDSGDMSYRLPQGDYVLSVVFADGSVYSHPFTSAKTSESVFDWGTLSVSTVSGSYRYYLVTIAPTTAIDLVGVEIVPGTKSNFSAELVSSVIAMPVDQMNTPTLAVKTDIEFGDNYQLGGVRPSVPEKGQVWAMIENQRIVSLQVYNGQAWEAVEGRIWTGARWIPPSSYNIITLQDMYDIVDATPDFEYIYSESGFWAWWQKSWNAFTERLFAALGNGNGVSGGIPEDALPVVPDDETTEENESWSVWDLLIVLRDGTWKVITGTVSTAFDGFTGFVSSVSNAGGFFEAYDSKNPDGVLADYGGEDIWTQ